MREPGQRFVDRVGPRVWIASNLVQTTVASEASPVGRSLAGTASTALRTAAMEIAIRRAGGAWQLRPTQPYEREGQLQELLGGQPNLIPLHQLGDQVLTPRVAIRELPLRPAGTLDLLAVDEAGGLTLVECKLDANVESKRTVIGQVLEYASALWRMEYDHLDAVVCNRTDRSLADLMDAALTRDDPEFSPEDFRAGVERHLKAGDFRLTVAVDQVNDRLRAIVEYLNNAGPSSMSLHLLEVRYFVSGDSEVLIPQLHGEVSLPTRTVATGKNDREAFLAGCDDAGRRFFSAILAGIEAIGLRPDSAAVAFTIAVTADDHRVPILRGYPAAAARGQRLTLLPGLWRAALPAGAVQRLERQLAVLPGMPSEVSASKIPIPVDGRFHEVQAKAIVEAVTELVNALEPRIPTVTSSPTR